MQTDHRNSIVAGYTLKDREEYWNVYTSVARHAIRVDSGLAILSHAESEERPSMLPSWVPNWNIRQPTESFGGYLHFDAGLSAIWKYRPPLETTSSGRTCLRVCGTDTGTIIATSMLRYSSDDGKISATQNLKSITDAASLCENMYILGDNEEIATRLARTLVANTGNTNCDAKYSGNVLEDLKVFQQCLQARIDGEESFIEEQYKQIDSYVTQLPSTWQHRCFFITDNGQMGLASQSCRLGDKICIFLSAITPFILRPIDASDAFTLVCDAYVDGIMYGEAVEGDGDGFRDTVIE
jgi:hypothetical protein